MKKYFKINNKYTVIVEDTCCISYYYATIAKVLFTINIPFTDWSYTYFSKLNCYNMSYYHGMDFKEESNKVYEMYIKEIESKKEKREILKSAK